MAGLKSPQEMALSQGWDWYGETATGGVEGGQRDKEDEGKVPYNHYNLFFRYLSVVSCVGREECLVRNPRTV